MADTFDVQSAIKAGAKMSDIMSYLAQNPDVQPDYGQNTQVNPPASIASMDNSQNVNTYNPRADTQGQTDLTGQVGNWLINLGKGIVNPFINTGKTIGGAAFEAVRQPFAVLGNRTALNAQNPFLSDQELEAYSKDPLGQIFKQAGNSAQVVSWGVPIGEGGNFVSKFLLPGAEMGALQSGGAALAEGKPANQVVGQTAMGAGAGAVGAGLTGGLSSILGRVAGKEADSLATGALNITDKQNAKYAQRFGESIADTLNANKVAGESLDGLTEKAIDPLNKTYGDIVNNSGLKIKQSTMEANLQKIKDEILKYPTTANKSAADALQKEYDDAIKPLFEDGMMDGSQANGFKQSYDGKTSPKYFMQDPVGTEFNRNMGTLFRQSIYNDAASSGIPQAGQLGQIGSQLQKLNEIQKLALARQGTSATTKTLLRSGLGWLLGGMGGNPLLGMAVGYGVDRAMSNPGVIGGASRVADVVGNTASNKLLQSILGKAGGQVGPNVINSVFSSNPNMNANVVNDGNNNQPGANGGDNIHTNSSISQPINFGPGVQKDAAGHYYLADPTSSQTTIPNQPYPLDLQLKDQQRAGFNPYAQAMIQNKAQINQQYVDDYLRRNSLNGDQKAFMDDASSQMQQYNRLRDLISEKGGRDLFNAVINSSPQVQYVRAQQDPKFAEMMSTMNTLRGAAIRAQNPGLRLTQTELTILNGLPVAGDTVTNAEAKLDRIQNVLAKKYSEWYPRYGLSVGGSGGMNQAAPQLNNYLYQQGQ